jgi:hypothetical protein
MSAFSNALNLPRVGFSFYPTNYPQNQFRALVVKNLKRGGYPFHLALVVRVSMWVNVL